MDQGDIETALTAAIEGGKVKGGIICASDAQGNFIYNKVLGSRTLLSGEKKPLELDDVVYLASATKLMASIAALQCVDDGLLTLTGDLSSVAPDLNAKQVLRGFAEDGQTPRLEPVKDSITLEMLLTHSAGTNYDFIDPVIAEWRQKCSPQPANPANHSVTFEESHDYPLGYQPGTSWMYGTGCDWAGRIIERLTGKTLGDFMQERIFSVLGFDDAEFYPVTRPELRKRLVDLNPDDPDAIGRAVLAGGGDHNKRLKGHFGGHGLFMTATGYLKVLRSLLVNDGKLLKPETVDDMFKNHLSPRASEGHRAALASVPMGTFFRVGIATGTKAGYGLGGLLTLEDVDGWYGANTLTWGGGHTFAWFIDRKNDLCGVGAIQASLPAEHETIAALKQTFRHDVYRKRQAWKDIEVSL